MMNTRLLILFFYFISFLRTACYIFLGLEGWWARERVSQVVIELYSNKQESSLKGISTEGWILD